jgi:IS605 OrfB family transposase
VGGIGNTFKYFLIPKIFAGIMQRTILLQTDATTSKQKTLKEASLKATELANFLLQHRKSKYLMDLHKTMYSICKKTTSFNSQVICDIERSIVRNKGKTIKAITVKFNAPRNCKTFNTKSKFFVELGIYPRNRIAIPIRQNRNYQRFQSLVKDGWICKTFGLISNLQVVAYLSKEEVVLPARKNVLGIDVNAKYFAISVVSPTRKVLYQTYFGKHIWVKRKKIMEKRALLQSLGATRKLKKLRHYERNFVKTNLGQIVKEIIKLATKYGADISIENLKKFSPKGKRFNKTVMRIPFYRFKQILEQRCFDNDIPLNIVDSWHTSKWCSRCGAVGKGHSANYSLFKCKCGQVVNADRKASLAVATKSLLERIKHNLSNSAFFQFSSRRVPVNGLLRSDASGLHDVVHPNQSSLGMPTGFSCG